MYFHKFILYLLLMITTLNSEIIDFNSALNLTLKNNVKIKSQELNIKQSKQEIKKLESISYGKVNLFHEMSRTNHAGYIFNSKLSSREATFNDFGANQFDPAKSLNIEPENLNYPDTRNNFNTKISYEIPLFTGFKLTNQKDILKLQYKAQNVKLNLDKKSLEYEVLSAYNNAVVAKEFIKAIKKAKEAVSFFVFSANEFHKEGLVTKIDKKQAKVHELNVQSKLINAYNNFDIAITYLKFLTSNEKIKDIRDLQLLTHKYQSLDALYEYALENRDDLNILKINKSGVKKNIELSKSSYFPSVYSKLEYGLNDDSITLDTDKDYYLATLGIKYTLFDDSRKYEKEKNKIEFNKTALRLNYLKDLIKLEVQKAFLNLNTKNKILKEKVAAKDLAYEVLEQSKLMYKNQLITMTELLKQEAIFRENEVALIMANYEKSLALAKLNLSIGKSLKE